MDRANLGRWLLIASGIFLILTFVGPKLFGGEDKLQPLQAEGVKAPEQRSPEQLCEIKTDSFTAKFSSRSASLKSYRLTTPKYRRDGQPIELVTTPDYELRRQLRFEFRNPAAPVKDGEWQVDHDLLDYQLAASTPKSCEFVYRTPETEVRKTITASGRPYELKVETSIKNLAEQPLRHAVTVHTDAWRTQAETSGGMFSVSPLITHVECVTDSGKTTRLGEGDFEPGEFEDKESFPRTPLSLGDWYQTPGKPAVASVSNAYFSQALVPLASPAAPTCQLQVEQRWNPSRFKSRSADPQSGAMYRARLAYPVRELKPGEEQKYSVLSYNGPKERSVLAEAGGGNTQLLELIDLGIFSVIAKVLVTFLLKVYSVIPNWGIAIMVLTVTARLLLFPLSVPGVRNMIRMRELKPEVDALNEKFKDDPQQKGLAQMELWRKHNVNPLKGCLPQLASMPVWFALYTTLQTAVELYNIPFLWFPDLSRPDPLYILPFIIGATSFVQQKMMPLQGDAAQMKMMLYFMPAMFTVFMLFLPSGLGVYMFTNGVLGIVQQQAVEWHARRAVAAGGGKGDIKVKVVDEARPAGKKGKGGKGGGRGTDESPSEGGAAKMGSNERLLGKGKA